MKKVISEKIKESLKNAKDLNLVAKSAISVLKEFKSKGANRIGYVAGTITSEGYEKIEENVKKLIKYTIKIRKREGFPIFSSTDLFDKKFVSQLKELSLPPDKLEEEFLKCWKNILSSGYVTDIYITPGWENSQGARFELKVAKEARLKIHYEE